jgi:hypothetical protein
MILQCNKWATFKAVMTSHSIFMTYGTFLLEQPSFNSSSCGFNTIKPHYWLILTALSSAHIIDVHDKVIMNNEFRKDVDGSGRGLFQFIVPAFAWADWKEPGKNWVKITGLRGQILVPSRGSDVR